MEAGSKIKKLVIGARELKDHLGRYLVQGLVVSVFLHSAVVALVGLLPSDKIVERSARSDTTVNIIIRPPIGEPNPVPPRPQRPVLPDVTAFVPIEEEQIEPDTLVETELPDLRGTVDGLPSDSGLGDDVVWLGNGGIAGTVGTAGVSEPWKEFVPREVEPMPLTEINPQPAYPKFAQKAGVEGKVYLWVHVSDRGDVIGWHVIDVNPAGLGFEDEVARVIPKWKFTPAIQQNNPVAVWVAIPFKFRVSP